MALSAPLSSSGAKTFHFWNCWDGYLHQCFDFLCNLLFPRGATLFLMRAAGERMSTLQFEINDITMMIGAASTVLIS